MGNPKTSRPARWEVACAKMREGLDELTSLRDEYQEWRDNLPENQESSPVAEKLDAVVDLDLDSIESSLSDCEGIDLPRGFGRD